MAVLNVSKEGVYLWYVLYIQMWTWWENKWFLLCYTDLQIKEEKHINVLCVYIISCLSINIWTGQTLGTSKWVLIPYGLMKGHICAFGMMDLNVIAFIFLIINQINNHALIASLIQEVKVKHGPVIAPVGRCCNYTTLDGKTISFSIFSPPQF